MYFIKRLVAAWIDSFGVFLGVLPGQIVSIIGSQIGGTAGMIVSLLGMLLVFAGALGAWYFLVIKRTVDTGQSLGKKFMGLKLVSADNAQFTIGAILIREIVKGVISTVCGLAHAFVFIDKEQQALHDKVAKTYVREA